MLKVSEHYREEMSVGRYGMIVEGNSRSGGLTVAPNNF